MRRLVVFTGISAIMAVSAVAAQAQSLSEALAMAYRNNPTLEAQRAKLRSIDEGVPQALSGWRPDVKVTADAAHLHRTTNNFSTGGNDDRNSYSGDLTVTQNLYQGGQTEAEITQSKHLVSAERARLQTAEQSVLLDAVTAYMNVYREEAVLKLNIGNEQVLTRQLEATRDRFNVGEVTRTDVAQAELRLARAKAVRIQAEGDLEVSRAFYRQIVGQAPVAVPKPDYPASLPKTAADAVKTAGQNNPQVISALYDERAAQAFVALRKGELLPSVDLVGDASHSRNAAGTDRTINDLTLTAELTVPIYQQGAVSSQSAKRSRLRGSAGLNSKRRAVRQRRTRPVPSNGCRRHGPASSRGRLK